MRERILMSTAALYAVVLATSCGSDTSTPLPCAVEAVIDQRCRIGHSDPTEFHAPMPIIDWEATQGSTPSDSAVPVWKQMQLRVHLTRDPMPPSAVLVLTPDELAPFDAWFAAGAPAGALDQTCM